MIVVKFSTPAVPHIHKPDSGREDMLIVSTFVTPGAGVGLSIMTANKANNISLLADPSGRIDKDVTPEAEPNRATSEEQGEASCSSDCVIRTIWRDKGLEGVSDGLVRPRDADLAGIREWIKGLNPEFNSHKGLASG